jgi:putative flippase GtrA
MSIVKQGISYGFVGVVQIGVDWLTFIGLTQLGVLTGPANITGRIVGAILGFWLNGRFTFAGDESRPLRPKHAMKFLVSWSLTTLLSTGAVMLAAHTEGLHMAWVVKPLADLTLAAIGFAASKYWIYK